VQPALEILLAVSGVLVVVVAWLFVTLSALRERVARLEEALRQHERAKRA
jgi:hypothetical protein